MAWVLKKRVRWTWDNKDTLDMKIHETMEMTNQESSESHVESIVLLQDDNEPDFIKQHFNSYSFVSN